METRLTIQLTPWLETMECSCVYVTQRREEKQYLSIRGNAIDVTSCVMLSHFSTTISSGNTNRYDYRAPATSERQMQSRAR